MIYFLDGKTFLKRYCEDESPKNILGASYIIVSSSIKKSGRYEKQMANAWEMLSPGSRMLVDVKDWKNDEEYHQEYIEERLEQSRPFIASVIQFDLTGQNKGDTIFICSEKEKKYFFFPLMQFWMDEVFGYHMVDYKRYKKGKDEPIQYSDKQKKKILKKCEKILKKAQEEKEMMLLSSEEGREKYYKTAKKKDLKKKLKDLGLYHNGMDKDDMIQMLDAFI